MTRTTRTIITTLVLFFSNPSLLASAFTPRTPAFATRVGAAAVVAVTRRRTLLFVAPQETTVTKADAADSTEKKADDGTEKSEKSENAMDMIKEAGLAGFISYAIWELAFWLVSIPFALGGYVELTGHWPDLSDKDDVAKLGAEAFAFVNFARFAVPLRIGLAISTIPWVEENIVERFSLLKDKGGDSETNGADDEQKDAEVMPFKGENGDMTSSLESEKESTTSGEKKGFIKRIISNLPFRRRSKE